MPAAAYRCLTEIERVFGDGPEKRRRDNAARALRIDPQVLYDLGDLSVIGRKAASEDQADNPKLTDEQRGRLEAIMELVVDRVAQIESGVPLKPSLISQEDVSDRAR